MDKGANLSDNRSSQTKVDFIDPMGYEMLEELIEGYSKIILDLEKEKKCPRYDTYGERSER